MSTVRDTAVVLRRIEYSETSQVLAVFTRDHGRVRLIAKGVKRSTKTRFAPAIDLLEEGSLLFSPRTGTADALSILTEWKQTRSFSGLRERLIRIRAAEYVAETTAMLTQDFDPHAALYDALTATLTKLTDAGDDAALAEVAAFQRNLLVATGLLPRFDACVLCESAGSLPYFSALEGGMLCRSCEVGQAEKRAVSAATLNVLRGDNAAKDVLGAFDILDYHLAHAAGREPATAAALVPPQRRRSLH